MKIRTLFIALFISAGGAPLLAQQQTGTLLGRVTDSSGAALPGVTVTLAGPTILGGSATVVTNDVGAYRIPNVPAGTYNLRFELPGFQTTIFEAVRAHVGASFTIDAQLAVGAVRETVTVSGAAPIIETAATDVSFTFTKELMETIPNARDVWAMVSQAPGMTMSVLNVGGTNTGNQTGFRAHGSDPRQNVFLLNGVNVTDNTGVGGSQLYYDVDSFDEVQIEMNSHTAEVQSPGIVLNMVPKSGTNNLHGTGTVYYGNDAVQSDNVDDALRARGVDRASNLHEYLDSGFDLGGPIARDRVWFWGAFRWQEIERFVTGTRNPDGSFPIDRTFLWYPSLKVDWLATQSHRVSGFFNMQQKKRFNSGLSALRPLETTLDQMNNPISRVVSVRDDWTVSPRAFVSLKGNYLEGAFQTRARPGVDTNTTPARLELSTNSWSGAPPSTITSGRTTASFGGTLNYSATGWGGEHDLKFGSEFSRMEAPQEFGYPADHRLRVLNGRPLEVMLFGPGRQNSVVVSRSAFAQDGLQAGRVTLNVGLRWDFQSAYLPEEVAPTSRFFTEPVRQTETDTLIAWNTLAPRVGVVYDVTGHAKTLLKGSLSRYYWTLWTGKASQASLAGDRIFLYGWNDVNADRNFTVNELGTLLSVDDPATRPITIDPDLEPSLTDEVTAGIAHELMANLSVSATYMYRKDKDIDWRIHRDVSAADYTPVTGVDPGPDGTRGTSDDGGSLVFYEISTAKRTLSPDVITTRPGYSQDYRGLELTAHRRMSSGWQLVTSLTVGSQRENYGQGSFQNPQDIDKLDGTRIETSRPYVGKIMGSYMLPFEITVSGFYQFLSGTPFTRTVNSVNALGRNLNQGNVAALAGERNAESLDTQHLLDVRLGYELPVRRANMSLALDIFNALNLNTVTQINSVSGPAYNRVIDFIPPRILRFGARVRF
jgi:hypothetical protein